ncbi:MAG: ATP-binding protein [Bryobacterales bacterium]|nr:ATP-binding protein [Bryobacterales bacterium]
MRHETEWSEQNRLYLTAALGTVRARLEGGTAPECVAAGMRPAPAIEALAELFGLSEFERQVLLLCAGVEFDSEFAAAVGAGGPTFSLALGKLEQPHWSALAAESPLRYWRLIEVSSEGSLTRSRLRVAERVLHYLAGLQTMDRELSPLVEAIEDAPRLSGTHCETARRIASLLRDAPPKYPVIHLAGTEARAKQAVAAQAAAALGLELFLLRAADLPASPADRETVVRLWEREAILRRAALLIEMDEMEPGTPRRAVAPLLDATQGVLFASTREPLPALRRSIARFDVMPPAATEQLENWRDVLGEAAAARMDGELDAVAAQFRVTREQMEEAAAEYRAAQLAVTPASLWGICRRRTRVKLDDLAQRIESAAGWDDLVLPEAQKATLRRIAVHLRHRYRVYEAWGFAARSGRGLGIHALFAGASGTGKTMAAEVLARELDLDLYRIDLSAVVSKYIGETEKNLRRLFDEADGSGAILLFDEADALFGKRSEVHDSHDRYANLEISYLLQRMESYRGLAILTTNMKNALDTAFLRRLRFVVEFPFPDQQQRREIWRRMFPAATPLHEVDFERLAQLGVAGGSIRNIALEAAFQAAGESAPVGMRHLLEAARAECGKLERPLAAAETGGWV